MIKDLGPIHLKDSNLNKYSFEFETSLLKDGELNLIKIDVLKDYFETALRFHMGYIIQQGKWIKQ